MKLTLPRVLLVLAALLAAVAGFYLAGGKLTGPARSWQAARGFPQFGSGRRLHSHRQRRPTRSRARDLKGAPALVFFGFTRCPDVCPTTLLKLAQVRREAGLANLRVVFVSIDPQRDTPAVLDRYVHAFDPAFIGLTGEPAAVTALARHLNVAVNRVELPGGDYTMDHSAVVFLLDAQARVVAIFTPPFDTKLMAADLKSSAPFLKAKH